MSLLIKALEQAAKERKGRAESASSAAPAMGRSAVEPAIEPQSSAPFEPTLEPPPPRRTPPASTTPAAPAASATSAAPAQPAASAAPASSAAPQRAPNRPAAGG